MAPIDIADYQESCAGDEAKDAARRTVEESRETRSIEGFFGPAHGKPPLGREKRIGNSFSRVNRGELSGVPERIRTSGFGSGVRNAFAGLSA
jgi:hypothetical protein